MKLTKKFFIQKLDKMSRKSTVELKMNQNAAWEVTGVFYQFDN